MSLIETRICACKHCQRKFEKKIYTSVNVTENPSMKKPIMLGEVYRYICPICQKKGYCIYPLLYHDMEKKILIQSGRNEIIYHTKNIVDGLLHNDFGMNYRFFGATNALSLSEKVIALEYGYDPNVMELYKVKLWEHIQKKLKEKKSKKKVIEVSLCLNKDGAYILVEAEEEENYFQKYLKINQKAYRILEEKYKETLDQNNYVIFERNEALELIRQERRKKKAMKKFITKENQN